ncbi:MAG: hypothetical protein A2233_05530 [Candidatus Kerfeldbacteria bacterium RIFOXYA2_FULL_38_24]|uniref:Polymerase beta nucleotidyltransferase domain-containing protein n=1 Tax=Candidatus Kerfeldbacteria bacterium RIFOXYB2_FULL_38_14 TaxID=1798547 RepID=A0A1G2BJ79_9BACT|nr:MAG: hypothetical protein A2233_05530 [Candidatus Kerfeldbacteria bacterium RIFOXYA2_FULL_38_24]OGY88287.1 MAG: hypothetical protein A2319_03815 [Candidatus Kerfeldbacteria bacterium RIFOXYB2_FULL_38_14]OGY89738.1 MAG: hypothetical protein A2458_01615 [Candidatus Kerfeldbacteria bacterium RIFOXYC2_FULL_38_9]
MSKIHTALVHRLVEVLKEDERVLAAWVEGSLARSEADDYSDIDLWLCVKDNAFEDFIDSREQFAAQLGPVLSILYPRNIDHDFNLMDSFKIIFEDQPLTLTLDVEVQKRSRKFFFTKDSEAEECRILFDRAEIIKYRPFNPQIVEQHAEEVFDDVVVRFWHQVPLVLSHIYRGDLLEAMNYYWQDLNYLISLYRILYTPEKVDWGFKDIEYDLPEEVIKELYDLMPHPHPKALPKLLKKLAKRFFKQSRVVGKRIKAPVPSALAQAILKEL